MEPPRFPLVDCGPADRGPRCEAPTFHNETVASKIADFLVVLAPVFVRIF